MSAARDRPAADATAGPPDRRDLLSIVYVLHLLVPSLLLIDVLHAARSSMAEKPDLLLGALCGLWVVLGLGCMLVTRDRTRLLRRVGSPLLGVYSAFLFLVVLELGLRATYGDWPPAVWRPGLHLAFRPDPEVFPGVSGVVQFRVNELGVRGPALHGTPFDYRIVAIGGSTTLNLMLDDSRTWPQELMHEMNARQQSKRVWVGNTGVNGHNALHHLGMLRDLPIARQAELVLILCGINDLQATLAFEGASTRAPVQKEVDEYRDYLLAGATFPFPLYRRLLLCRLARRGLDGLVERSGFLQRQETWDIAELRRHRAAGPLVPMPDLAIGLREYRERLEALARECTLRGHRCVFLTQPTLWRPDLPADAEALLLFGWVGPKFRAKGFVPVPELSQAMDSYNRVMREVSAASHVECFDLAATLPKDTSVFYDDAHVTEAGAHRVATALAEYILALPPFASEPTGSSPAGRD